MNEQTKRWQHFAVDDGGIEFIERGRGDPVFLVHAGLFSDWFRFVGESHHLDRFRVVRLRRAGYGQIQPTRHLTLADHGRHAAALAEHLCAGERIHWIGHSSSCQIVLELAAERPVLVGSLILLEPAAAGAFQVPASAALGPFLGAAMAAFQSGDLTAAFDSFMRGVCGEGYREIIEARLGTSGLEEAIRESTFFFRDEVSAVLECRFGSAEAAKIRQAVLCMEGGAQPPHLTTMSQQISERTVELLPQAQVTIIPQVNHALPLQDPDAVAKTVASFVDARSHE